MSGSAAKESILSEEDADNLLESLDKDKDKDKVQPTEATGNTPEAKPAGKKVKVWFELDASDVEEMKVLTMLNIYPSKEEFFVEAVKEKKAEVMAKLKTAVKKK